MSDEMIKDVISAKKEITLGGKVFTIKSINIAGIADFQDWCLSRKKKELIDIYKMSEQVVDIKEVMALSIDEDEYQKYMATVPGICFLLRKVINDNNDEKVDIDFVKKNVNLDNVQELTEIILADFMEEDKEEEPKNVVAKSQ